jgi:hypothetical protein
MPDSALFMVELLTQDAETGLAPCDPLSAGTMRVTMAGVEVWNDETNLTSSALCLLRTTRGDFVGPIEGVSDTNPLIHHCGVLPETGCPIGASWRVRHIGANVHIDRIVRASEIDRDEDVAGIPLPFVMPREDYARPIRAFALAVRAELEREPDRYRAEPDPFYAHMFEQFWTEYDMLLSSSELIATALTPERISAVLFDATEASFVEAASGMYLIDVCTPSVCEAIVQRAKKARWNAATINANRSVDPEIRNADVLDEAADAGLTEACRELLFEATRDIAALLVPNTVLAEVQIVRYLPGGHYADHRDSPALGATPRALSIVWYLSDDFTGGETRFSNPDIIVSPVSGVAIAFSPVLMHRAEPIITGAKYAVTAWYHDIPASIASR